MHAYLLLLCMCGTCWPLGQWKMENDMNRPGNNYTCRHDEILDTPQSVGQVKSSQLIRPDSEDGQWWAVRCVGITVCSQRCIYRARNPFSALRIFSMIKRLSKSMLIRRKWNCVGARLCRLHRTMTVNTIAKRTNEGWSVSHNNNDK